jgi:CRP-like cAMP-binding protein
MQQRITSAQFNEQFFTDILLGLIPGLPVDAASELARACVLQKYAPGEPLIREGDLSSGIFLLISGTVQPAISNEALPTKRQVSLPQIEAPAVLGIAGSMLAQPSLVAIRALTSTEAGFISQSHVRNVLRDSPETGLAFSQLLAEELSLTYACLEQLRCPKQPISLVSPFN